jgi:hypothetical protein
VADRRDRLPGNAHARRLGPTGVLVLLAACGAWASACGGQSSQTRASSAVNVTTDKRAVGPAAPVAVAHPAPRLLVATPARATTSWRIVARVRGQPAAWISQRSGATLMRFDQSRVHLTLHSGVSDGGASGSRYGDRITAREIHLLIAAFNGGFKLTYHDVGFVSGHHVAAPLKAGLASVVTYTDGTTDIGAWHVGVPLPHKRVFSVLQNQRLLVDHGVTAASASNCIEACWGETLGAHQRVARSGLGIAANGQLVWAAGENLLPADLAKTLIRAGAVRAIELDINPFWVAGYLYLHHRSGPSPVPVVPGQHGIEGELLEPDNRDFLAIVAN